MEMHFYSSYVRMGYWRHFPDAAELDEEFQYLDAGWEDEDRPRTVRIALSVAESTTQQHLCAMAADGIARRLISQIPVLEISDLSMYPGHRHPRPGERRRYTRFFTGEPPWQPPARLHWEEEE
jgi:hypothetical protein